MSHHFIPFRKERHPATIEFGSVKSANISSVCDNKRKEAMSLGLESYETKGYP